LLLPVLHFGALDFDFLKLVGKLVLPLFESVAQSD